MRLRTLCGLAVLGCGFDPSGAPSPAPGSAVYFVSASASVSELRPGLYGFEIEAVLRNDLDVEITGVAASLRFADEQGDRSGDFRWRDVDMREAVSAPQPGSIPPGGEATYRFVVDALPWAAPPGPILVTGVADFVPAAGAGGSAAPLSPPLALEFSPMNPPIVVTSAVDGGGGVSFRQAIAQAIDTPGLDRIVFDPAAFPPGSTTLSVLDHQLGALPILDGSGGDLVIDGSGAGFHLALDQSWEAQEGRYGLRLTGGSLVVYGIGFHNLAFNYRNEGDLSGSNCGPSGAQLEGGAIRADGGALILDGNTFADPDVAERNCYGASVRLHGGAGHRILGNLWTEQAMDSLYIDAATIEVADNVMNAGSDPDKSDECIYIESQGGTDLWVIGNLCVDQEYSGLIARGTDPGVLYVVHNTFVRNGRVALAAVRREEATRQVVFRNNVYLANAPAALRPDGDGAGFDLAHELVADSPLCDPACTAALIDEPTVELSAQPMFRDPTGDTLADFTPAPGSPLIGAGTPLLDRNGKTPGRHNGAAPDLGAVELP